MVKRQKQKNFLRKRNVANRGITDTDENQITQK